MEKYILVFLREITMTVELVRYFNQDTPFYKKGYKKI